MKKVDVYNFINKVERKAVCSVSKKYDDIIKKEEEKSIAKYKKDLDKLDDALSELKNSYSNIMKKIGKDKNYNVTNQRHSYSNDMFDLMLVVEKRQSEDVFKSYNVKSAGKLLELKNKKNKEESDVRNEYYKVMCECHKLKTAKNCITYLNKLGFDTSSIEVKEEVKTDDINKSKLFVCGDNK